MSSGDPNKRSSLTAQGTSLRHTVFFQKASNVATLLMHPLLVRTDASLAAGELAALFVRAAAMMRLGASVHGSS
jgi:hypothetical protein